MPVKRFATKVVCASSACVVAASCLLSCFSLSARNSSPTFVIEDSAADGLVPAVRALVSAPRLSTSRPGSSDNSPRPYRSPEEARKPPTKDELEVIASAETLVGEPPNAKVVVKGKLFVLDCIGTVSAIFYRMDIDIAKDFAKYPGNGAVAALLPR
jgi:hypothetical protein